MSVTIRECTNQKEWDSLVDNSIHPTTFHRFQWLKLIEKHSGTKLHALIASMGTNDIGILPVFYKKSRGMRMLFSPPPKSGLTNLGPLTIRYDKVLKAQTIEKATHASIDAFDTHIKEEFNPNYIRLSTVPGYTDARPLTWAKYDVHPEYTYISDISGGPDTILANYQKQLRTDLKKTIKEGVTVEEGGKKELDMIQATLAARFEQQGVSTNLTKEYLRDLYDAFHPSNFRIFIAKYKGDHVGGFICVCHPDRASYWAGGGKTDIKGIYPNDLLQFEAMKWAHSQGYKRYEIVDAGDERLRHFKSKFNPDLVIWFQAERHSPSHLKHLEPAARAIFRKFRLGGLT